MSYDFFFLKIYHVCLNIIPFQGTKSFKLCFFKYMYYVLSDYRCQSIDQLFKSLRIHDYYIMITLPISIVCTFISVEFFFFVSWVVDFVGQTFVLTNPTPS